LDDEATPAVISLFDQWGRGGAVVEQAPGKKGGTTLKTYLLSEDDESLRQIEIGLALLDRARHTSTPGDSTAIHLLPKPRIRFLSEKDWAEAWKTHYDVLRVGRRLVIKPTWRDYDRLPDDLVIELDPGMAFGSGLHPTTRLCLEALEDYLQPGTRVLDVGTGSGILAIAAARLGASQVLALDSDPLAVRVADENVVLNGVESVVRIEVGTVKIGESGNRGIRESGNLVVANILAETIVELMAGLVSHLAAEGTLITSGIIADRAEAVVASLHEHGVSLVERRDEGEWVALVAREATNDEGRLTKDDG
jgi:ribosomal protein L11 methyltransferase